MCVSPSTALPPLGPLKPHAWSSRSAWPARCMRPKHEGVAQQPDRQPHAHHSWQQTSQTKPTSTRSVLPNRSTRSYGQSNGTEQITRVDGAGPRVEHGDLVSYGFVLETLSCMRVDVCSCPTGRWAHVWDEPEHISWTLRCACPFRRRAVGLNISRRRDTARMTSLGDPRNPTAIPREPTGIIGGTSHRCPDPL